MDWVRKSKNKRLNAAAGVLAFASFAVMSCQSPVLDNLSDPFAHPALFFCVIDPLGNCPRAANLGPGPILWFRADALAGFTDGQVVPTWSDSSGHGHDATAPAAAPVYRATGLNGRPALEFASASSRYLEIGAVTALDSEVMTWFLVMSVPVTATSRSVLRSNYSGGASAVTNLMWGTFHESNRRHSHARGSSGQIAVPPFIYSADPVVHSAVWDASDRVMCYENGVLAGLTHGASAAPSGHNYSRIGANTAGAAAEFMDGFVAELVVYTRALSDGERAEFENYLRSKYGL